MQSNEQKQKAYECDVVYGTNAEFGFDYLRDNMKLSVVEQVQRKREFCIVDEVDSILIDEARTPLIISGPAHEDAPAYGLADTVARHLMTRQREWDGANERVEQTIKRIKGLEGDIRNAREKDKIPDLRAEMKRLQDELPALEEARDKYTQFYEVERDKKASHLTHEGVAEAQKQANIGSFYVGQNMDFPHQLENALRAHAVYQRDKDYVVQNGEVIIVDEFTGRLMIGRQWSDGLHQAVEAKERVTVKQETQTLATVTIQNFFKLYHRLAGMTGTALTEATEFHDIYGLDVVSIPTNVPVIRRDNNDMVFTTSKDKWNAILDEIKRMHDVGRPVLVGTTSVENSEVLSQMLTKKYAIKHEVLNAKQHEREAAIVAHAGEQGAVMIATNMAGRGTDIKLAPIDRAALVRHWQMRNLLPREATPEMTDEQVLALSFRHQARMELGISPKEAEGRSDDDLRLALLRHWVVKNSYYEADKVEKMSAEQCLEELDGLGDFLRHRAQVYTHVEQMGGLHIVGTERHEARRIDNQLRGRAGRQGDQGSSRFFISLEDDLMKMFAGPKTLALLSKFGMKEGDHIEHGLITRSVERAQRKVEERNFEIRKNLLEYDEVMEHQRNAFYGTRQTVLEGREVQKIIFDYIADAVADATELYLDKDYVATQVAEWCRQELDVTIEPFKLRETDPRELQNVVRQAARDDTRQTIDVTIGEYMSNDLAQEDWDLRGLSSWAMTRFSVDLKQGQARKMNIDEVKTLLTDAALAILDKKDLSGCTKFLEPAYAQKQLAAWAKTKFGLDLDGEKLAEMPDDQIAPLILEQARAAYEKREVAYPVEYAVEFARHLAQNDGKMAAEQLVAWANRRYQMNWTVEQISVVPLQQLQDQLLEASAQWHRGGKLEALVDQAIAEHPQAADLAHWAVERFGQPVTETDVADAAQRREVLLARGRALLRSELTQLERFVLLQILDMAWKDHLYAMDQLKDSVGLRGYAERDPRIEYKREGSALFQAMQQVVRDRVTDLIFRAWLTAEVQARNVYATQQAEHAEAASATKAAEPSEDQEAAERAGAPSAEQLSRRARRAAAAGANEKKPEQAHRAHIKERKRRR
jgi:preprotein translocase subunit SecA